MDRFGGLLAGGLTGLMLHAAVLVVIGVFLSDLALAVLDPRIRLSGGATK